ncbi:HET-domain-containing protein [Hypoxylon crocopeplum]|nr:HET-domain-containing protein [Hypoxylon crocopeplum]
MSDYPSLALCERCKAVILDDSKIGARVARDDDGKEFLKMDTKPGFRHPIPINYSINDSYPCLPFLSKSAEAGCKFCDFLRATVIRPDVTASLLENGFDEDKIDKVRISMQYIWQGDMFGCPTKGLRALEIDFDFYEGIDSYKVAVSCLTESPQSKEERKTQGDDQAGLCTRWLGLNSIEYSYCLNPASISWIQNILKSKPDQPLMKTQSNSGFMPTRLICVDFDPPRLIETSCSLNPGVENSSIQYAALSYCWGLPEQARSQLKTERSSLEARLTGIEEHDMTRVLQDAVKTCRALTIPYLWMDALCIIQDDPLDWERESASMGKIYSGAYLTVAALSSESCTEGFLYRQPAEIEIPFRSNIKPEICGSYNLGPSRVGPLRAWVDEMDEDYHSSKLTRRAWAFQESVMSTRILAFGRRKTHLFQPNEFQTQGKQRVEGGYTLHIAQLDHCTRERYYEWWSSVVSEYSNKQLTYEMDRFPALSGIAQYFGRVLQDEYVAGLWKRDIYKALFWCRGRPKFQKFDALLYKLGNISTYTAPSWSWASDNHCVKHGFDTFHVYCSLIFWGFQREYRSIETRITLHGNDPFGQLREASLQITTRICSLPDDMRDIRSNEVCIGRPEEPFAHGALDWGPPGLTEPRSKIMMALLGSALEIITEDKDHDKEEGEEEYETTEIVDDVDSDEGEDDEDGARFAYGLLIYPAPGTNKFFRVGVFYSKPSDGWGMRLFEDYPETTVVLV